MRVERAFNSKIDQHNVNHETHGLNKLKRLFLPINASLEKQIRDIKARLYPSQTYPKHQSHSTVDGSETAESLKKRVAEQASMIESLEQRLSLAESRANRLQGELDELRAKTNDLVEEFVSKDEANARDYEARIRRLKSEHEHVINLIKREHDLVISDRNRIHIEYVEKLSKTHLAEQEAVLQRARESQESKTQLEGKIEELQRQLRVARLDTQRVADLRHEVQISATEIASLKDELATLRLERYDRSNINRESMGRTRDDAYPQVPNTKGVWDLQRGLENMELDRSLEKALQVERAKNHSQQLMGQIRNIDLLKTPENPLPLISCHTKDLLESPITTPTSHRSRPPSFSHLASPIADTSRYQDTSIGGNSDVAVHGLYPSDSSIPNNTADSDDTTQFVIQYPRIS